MVFHKTELLSTYSEENFNEAVRILEEGSIKFESKVSVTEDEEKNAIKHYYIYVKEKERDRIYQLFRHELEIFVY